MHDGLQYFKDGYKSYSEKNPHNSVGLDSVFGSSFNMSMQIQKHAKMPLFTGVEKLRCSRFAGQKVDQYLVTPGLLWQ